MSELKLKTPSIVNVGVIPTDKLQTALTVHVPQIIQHLAFLPIESQKINTKLLQTVSLIEEFELEQDLIVKEHEDQDYGTAVYINKTDKRVIVPAATHLKGGHQNRGNNQTEILGAGDEKTFEVNCFEPNRGSGGDHFIEFDDVPADVARETMIETDGYNGTWKIIEDYTEIAGMGRQNALASFNERTKEERAKYALNFETVKGQTGEAIITKGLSVVEVFPTPEVFNLYQQRVLRGKVASLFYRLHKSGQSLILPSEVSTKMNEMMKIVSTAIDQTVEHGTKDNGLIVGRHRDGDKALDIVLTDEEKPQVAYIFGAW